MNCFPINFTIKNYDDPDIRNKDIQLISAEVTQNEIAMKSLSPNIYLNYIENNNYNKLFHLLLSDKYKEREYREFRITVPNGYFENRDLFYFDDHK